MKNKQLLLFVFILFSIIGLSIFLTSRQNSMKYKEITNSSIQQFKNLHFYKDFLRNEGGGQNIPIRDIEDQKEFLAALKTMQPTSETLKSLTIEMLYRIQFQFVTDKEDLLTINIHRCKETGNRGIITIDQGESLQTSLGRYESESLLKWVENMKKKPGFKKIGGKN